MQRRKSLYSKHVAWKVADMTSKLVRPGTATATVTTS
jgi:hypothetical protein